MIRKDKSEAEVIVKRRKKNGHQDEHGGAWKVAFADFTLAMMALFMVLWVIALKDKEAIVAAAKTTATSLIDGGAGVFDGKSRTPLDLDGVDIPQPKPSIEQRLQQSKQRIRISEPEELEQFAALLRSLASQGEADANLEIQVVPQGLRVLVKDDENRAMFARGSAKLDPYFQGLLEKLSAIIQKVDNRLIISGHTDSVPYRRATGYDNWNLSGDRAQRARNVLVASGLPNASILQVTAQADVMPLDPDHTEAGANRRIEILLLTDRAEKLYKELFGDSQIRADYSYQEPVLQKPVLIQADSDQSGTDES